MANRQQSSYLDRIREPGYEAALSDLACEPAESRSQHATKLGRSVHRARATLLRDLETWRAESLEERSERGREDARNRRMLDLRGYEHDATWLTLRSAFERKLLAPVVAAVHGVELEDLESDCDDIERRADAPKRERMLRTEILRGGRL